MGNVMFSQTSVRSHFGGIPPYGRRWGYLLPTDREVPPVRTGLGYLPCQDWMGVPPPHWNWMGVPSPVMTACGKTFLFRNEMTAHQNPLADFEECGDAPRSKFLHYSTSCTCEEVTFHGICVLLLCKTPCKLLQFTLNLWGWVFEQ